MHKDKTIIIIIIMQCNMWENAKDNHHHAICKSNAIPVFLVTLSLQQLLGVQVKDCKVYSNLQHCHCHQSSFSSPLVNCQKEWPKLKKVIIAGGFPQTKLKKRQMRNPLNDEAVCFSDTIVAALQIANKLPRGAPAQVLQCGMGRN